ncbi:MAG: AI-2E family transporter [Steroidobacteraceae bacterium]|nr:AI-2E family transporter [Nevskiaceae bacterium]MCP5471013.1 AI-2E family transporter [Nevskiaceae bacterium]
MEDLTRALWLRRLIVASLLAGLLLLAFQVLQPFLVPVIWAVILAYVTWPAHERLVKVFRGRRSPAALTMTILMVILIVAPLVWLVMLVQTELMGAFREIRTLLAGGLQLPDVVFDLPLIGDWLRDWLARISANPDELLTEIRVFLDRSSGEFGGFIGGVGRNAVKLVIALLSLFFMFRDGHVLSAQLSKGMHQFLGNRVDGYLVAIGDTVKAVVYGLVLAALAQGTLAGVGYWFAGLEAPVFLGALTFLIALIPFGVPFMWVGASLWLLLKGETAAAIGLFIWGVTAVSWIDNIVRPLVISGATQIPFLLVMFGVLGGLMSFGLVGLFIGPVILAVLIAVWREWLAEKRAEGENPA